MLAGGESLGPQPHFWTPTQTWPQRGVEVWLDRRDLRCFLRGALNHDRGGLDAGSQGVDEVGGGGAVACGGAGLAVQGVDPSG